MAEGRKVDEPFVDHRFQGAGHHPAEIDLFIDPVDQIILCREIAEQKRLCNTQTTRQFAGLALETDLRDLDPPDLRRGGLGEEADGGEQDTDGGSETWATHRYLPGSGARDPASSTATDSIAARERKSRVR